MTDVMGLVYWFEKIFPYPLLVLKTLCFTCIFKKKQPKNSKSLVVFMKKNEQKQNHVFRNDLNLNNVTSTNQ